MKRSMRDNGTTLKFMWKTFEVKNHGPTTNKKFQYEEQSRCTWIYLTQDLQSLTDYLTSTFSPHHHAFIFKNMFGVLPKLDLNLLLETPWRRRWIFTKFKWLRDECSMNSTHFFFKKIIKRLAWRLVRNFIGKQTTSKRKENQELKAWQLLFVLHK